MAVIVAQGQGGGVQKCNRCRRHVLSINTDHLRATSQCRLPSVCVSICDMHAEHTSYRSNPCELMCIINAFTSALRALIKYTEKYMRTSYHYIVLGFRIEL